jgi:transposase
MTLNAIFWVMRTGSPWRDVPDEYGRGKTVWQWFDKWNDDGTLDSILDRLRTHFIDAGEIDDQLWCVDGTIVRAARCAGGGGKKTTPKNRRITR